MDGKLNLKEKKLFSRGNVRQRELCGSGCFGHLPTDLVVGVEQKLKGFNQM